MIVIVSVFHAVSGIISKGGRPWGHERCATVSPSCGPGTSSRALESPRGVHKKTGTRLRSGNDDLRVDELLVEGRVLALLVGSGDQSVALVLEPFAQAELVLGGSKQTGNLDELEIFESVLLYRSWLLGNLDFAAASTSSPYLLWSFLQGPHVSNCRSRSLPQSMACRFWMEPGMTHKPHAGSATAGATPCASLR